MGILSRIIHQNGLYGTVPKPPPKKIHIVVEQLRTANTVAIDSMNFEIVMLPSNICSPLKGGLVFNSKQKLINKFGTMKPMMVS